MVYLNNADIIGVGANWRELIDEIEKGSTAIKFSNYSQPLKLYLKYGSLKNRIIAMPAYAGINGGLVGLKWIASFPENLEQNIPRAHSVTILNEARTGIPKAVINSSKISSVRTAAVSGFVIDKFMRSRKIKEIKIGIIGLGPIGYEHLEMCRSLFGGRVRFVIFDKTSKVIRKEVVGENVKIAKILREVFDSCNIIITATNALKPYIKEKPQKGSLLVNVSLRDYLPDYFKYVKNGIIVDDWEEVNREGTNIESFSHHMGLKKDDVKRVEDLLSDKFYFDPEITYMFCPMGMAVFDIVIANYYYQKAVDGNYGILLEN